MEMVTDGDAGAAPARRQEGQAAEASGGCRDPGSRSRSRQGGGFGGDWLVDREEAAGLEEVDEGIREDPDVDSVECGGG